MSDQESRRRSEVCEAVRSLRLERKQTQQDFAVSLQTAIRTIARWETVRPPKGATLAMLARLAEDANRPDLAGIFRRALADQIGEKISGLTTEEEVWVGLLLALLRNRDEPAIRTAWKTVRDKLLHESAEVSARPELGTAVADDKLGVYFLAATGWKQHEDGQEAK